MYKNSVDTILAWHRPSENANFCKTKSPTTARGLFGPIVVGRPET